MQPGEIRAKRSTSRGDESEAPTSLRGLHILPAFDYIFELSKKSLVISCSVDCHAEPDSMLAFDGLAASRCRTEVSFGSLNSTHSGKYTCRQRDSSGHVLATKTVFLFVLGMSISLCKKEDINRWV